MLEYEELAMMGATGSKGVQPEGGAAIILEERMGWMVTVMH